MVCHLSKVRADVLLPLAALFALPSIGLRPLTTAVTTAKFGHAGHAMSHRVRIGTPLKTSHKKPAIIVTPIQRAYEWTGYGGNYSHTALSPVGAQAINHILWSTPVDAKNYNGNEILVHYGEVAVTALNDVVMSVRGLNGAPYIVKSLSGVDGSTIWSWTSTFVDPNHDWGPSFGPTILPALQYVQGTGTKVKVFPYSPRVAWPESGGRIAFRTNSDMSLGVVSAVAFYGNGTYANASSAFDAGVKVCTPLTAGPDGSIYFGYVVEASVPNNLQSGLAVVRPNGTGAFITAAAMSGDSATPFVPLNCTPALSPDGSKVYVEAASSASGWGRGYLCEVDTKKFTAINHVALMDVLNPNNWAETLGDSTASPMVGPDGDVYMGVLENPFLSNDDRGWMRHFSSDLKTSKIPGAFGWDDTASLVPASMVPSYTGTSKYLICTKYNDYADFGTQPGNNKIAILDPNDTEIDAVSGATTMKEIMTILGPTFNTALGKGVREWCVNSVAVDPTTKSVILNSEDGWAYRWDMVSGTFTEKIQLSQGIGEAYTPTAIGPNGVCYCINNAVLYALGQHP
jgi:hypothetical protein